MICIALKAISLSGELFVQPFISFVVSIVYFFAAAPVGSMNKFFFHKFFFQKTIRSYASWIFLDTSRRFCFPHLMFVNSWLTVSLAFWCCCDSVVIWRSFIALELAGWLSVTITSLVFLKQVRRCLFNSRNVKKLCTLQDVHRKQSFSPQSLVTSVLSSLADGINYWQLTISAKCSKFVPDTFLYLK